MLRVDSSALKSFIGRVVVDLGACPYTKSVDMSAVGLEQRGVTPGPVGYRYSPTTDACMTMSMFWNCICEMMSEPDANLSSIMLSLPGIGMGDSEEAHKRFAAVVELVGRYLCLFRGDGSFGLVHFHPVSLFENLVSIPTTFNSPNNNFTRPLNHIQLVFGFPHHRFMIGLLSTLCKSLLMVTYLLPVGVS